MQLADLASFSDDLSLFERWDPPEAEPLLLVHRQGLKFRFTVLIDELTNRPARDAFGCLYKVWGVEPSMKILGKLTKTPWERFVRLQRTVAKLSRGRGQPKGVFRFATHEACDAWTASLNRHPK
jgi:hypothetical protein